MRRAIIGTVFVFLLVGLATYTAWAQCLPQTERTDCPFGRCEQTGSRVFVECSAFGDLLGCEDITQMDRLECQWAGCRVGSTPIFRCGVIACDEESDCVNGGHCAFGLCQECRNDADCRGGNVCVASSCVARPEGFCRRDADCPRAFRCNLQPDRPRCQAYSGRCESDHDCQPGYTCLESFRIRGRVYEVGACIAPIATRKGCDSNDDCPRGSHCLVGKCAFITPGKDGKTPCLPNPMCPNLSKCGATGGMGLCPAPGTPGTPGGRSLIGK